MSDAPALAGGCLCGAIRYRLDTPTLWRGICHCVTCRSAAGAASVAWLTVAADGFRLERGTLATFASSPGVTRGFCDRCGTSLTYRSGPATIDVTLASLDDPEAAPPTEETWLSHRLSWTVPNPGLRPFPESGGATP